MFGDDPLESLCFDDIEKRDALFRYVIAESYFGEDGRIFFRSSFLLSRGQVRQVMPLEVQKIKDVSRAGDRLLISVILEHLEIRMS